MAADDAIDFRAVFASTPTPLLVISPDLAIVDVNECYVEMIGVGRDELIGRSIVDAVPALLASNDLLQRSLKRVFASGQPEFLPLLHLPATSDQGAGERYPTCRGTAGTGGAGAWGRTRRT